jgi:hypothetical protein
MARQFSDIGGVTGSSLRLPKPDLTKIAGLRQEQLAPTRAGLTRMVESVGAGRFANPVARREALRGAVRGAGEALAPAQAAATKTAYGLYRPEFEAKMNEALERYRLQLEEAERERLETESRGFEARLSRTAAPQTITRTPYGTFTAPGTSTIKGLERASARPGGLEPLPERIPSFVTREDGGGAYSSNWAA